MTSHPLSGIKDVDLEIIMKLNDNELGKVCSVNLYIRKLCNDENFWRKRTVTKFGKYLGNEAKINEYRENIPWKEYYQTMVKILDYISNFNLQYEERGLVANINMGLFYYGDVPKVYFLPKQTTPITNPGYILLIKSVLENTMKVVRFIDGNQEIALANYNNKADANIIFEVSLKPQLTNEKLIYRILHDENLKLGGILGWLGAIREDNIYYLRKILETAKEKGMTLSQLFKMLNSFNNFSPLKKIVEQFAEENYIVDPNILIDLLSKHKYTTSQLFKVHEILKK